MSEFLATQRRILKDWKFNLNPDKGGIRVPEWAFTPDWWNITFLRGLIKLPQWRQKGITAWEVGVGSGVNIGILRNYASDASFYFSDYNDMCVPLALENIQRLGRTDARLHPLCGAWDLVTPPAQNGSPLPKVHVVFGCIPQVPTDMDLTVKDRFAHYYNPQAYPEAKSHALGLGLNEALLLRAKRVLLPKGTVVLNLGGRPGRNRLETLFTNAGYRPRILFQDVIPQHAGTSLSSLVRLEHVGHDSFEFFGDKKCKEPINAREAETRRTKGKTTYHRIYVIAGTLAA